jgi:integrase
VSRRGPHEGSVYQRADGLWTSAVHLGYEGGVRRRKVLYGRTRREVQDKLLAVQGDVRAGLPIPMRNQSVSTFLKVWLDEVARPSVRPRTFRSYEQILRLHVLPDLGKTDLARLSPQMVQRLLNTKTKAGLSARSVRMIRDVLRNALNRALQWGLVSRNVATLVDVPHIPYQARQVFGPDEARLFLAHIAGDRLEALYSVALALGLRQGEALGLSWEDVDLDAAELHVRHSLLRIGGRRELAEPKTALSRRTIPLPGRAVSQLRAHRTRQLEERLLAGSRWQDTGFVFATTIGTPLDGPTVTKRFQAALASAGLPRQRFHDLRHGCASLLLAQGVAPRVVMELLGHSDIRLTMNTYTHVGSDIQRVAVDRLDALLATS